MTGKSGFAQNRGVGGGVPSGAVGRPAGYGQGSVTAAAIGGFAAGIVFWHLVGFWSLVNEVVFHHHPDDVAGPAPVRSLATKSQARQAGPTVPLAALNEACTDLLRGDDGGIRAGTCEPLAFKLAPARGIERADFADFGSAPPTKLINATDPAPAPGAPAVGGWAAEIAPSAKP